MRIPTALLCAVAVLALRPMSARAAPAVDEVDPVEARRAAALRLHEERRPAEAAALLEQLAAETGRAELLFDAGQARFAAGHRAHALRLWEGYARAPGRSGDDLALVARRIADARALLTPIGLEVHVPEDMSEATATLRRRYDPPDQQRPPIEVRLSARGGVARGELALDPGVWVLEVAASGVTARQELHVDRAARTVTLSLRPAPSPAPATATDRGPTRLGAGLGALAAAVAVPGAVLAGLGARRFHTRAGACATDTADPRCVETGLLAEVRLVGAGAGLLGAGLGLAAAAITAATRAPRRASIGELAGGGGLLALGAAWLAAENLAYARAASDDYLAWIDPWLTRRSVAAALLGAGAGLGLGAAARLLGARRNAARPALGLASVGLVLEF